MKYQELKHKFPKLLDDVRKFTSEIHGMESKGKAIPFDCYLEREGIFYEELSDLIGEKISPEEGYQGFISLRDGSIHLNFDAINDELCEERVLLVSSHLSIPQFLYFETNFGEWMRKKFMEGEISKLNEMMGILKGVCKGFELDAIENIKGYRLGELRKEVEERLKESKKGKISPEIYEGYSIYKTLKERVKGLQNEGWDFDESTHTAERILKASLLVAGSDENFDKNYRSLLDKRIEEIYALAGAEVYISAPVEEILKLCKKIREECTNQEVVFKNILHEMEELKDDLYHKGFEEEAEKFSEFVDVCSKTIKPTEVFKTDLLSSLNQRLSLIEVKCKEVMKRPPKIGFK